MFQGDLALVDGLLVYINKHPLGNDVGHGSPASVTSRRDEYVDKVREGSVESGPGEKHRCMYGDTDKGVMTSDSGALGEDRGIIIIYLVQFS